MGIVILDHDAATVKGPITSVFVIHVGNHLNSKTLKRKRAKVQLVRQGRSHMPTLVCWHQGTDLPQIAEATADVQSIYRRGRTLLMKPAGEINCHCEILGQKQSNRLD